MVRVQVGPLGWVGAGLELACLGLSSLGGGPQYPLLLLLLLLSLLFIIQYPLWWGFGASSLSWVSGLACVGLLTGALMQGLY